MDKKMLDRINELAKKKGSIIKVGVRDRVYKKISKK